MKENLIQLQPDSKTVRTEKAKKALSKMKKQTHFCDVYFIPLLGTRQEYLMRLEASSEKRLIKAKEAIKSHYTNELSFTEIKTIKL